MFIWLTGFSANPEAQKSQILIDVAPILEDFIVELFGIEKGQI